MKRKMVWPFSVAGTAGTFQVVAKELIGLEPVDTRANEEWMS